MSLINLIHKDDAPISLRSYYGAGDPGPLVSSMAHVPELLQVTMPFISAALGPSSVSAKIKEIIILRTSSKMNCVYCTNTHTVVANSYGLSKEEIVILRDEQNDFGNVFSEEERDLIRWCDAMANGSNAIPSVVNESLKSHFEDAEIVEFGLVFGCTLMLNRYATALKLPTSKSHLEWLKENDYPI